MNNRTIEQNFAYLHTSNLTPMKTFIPTAILVLFLSISYSQPYSELIGENIAVFYPDAFIATETLPSLALLEEPQVIGTVPADWAVTPEFFIEGGKNCARIITEDGTDLYGTGEVTGPLRRNETQVTLWNTDNYGYGTDNGKRLCESAATPFDAPIGSLRSGAGPAAQPGTTLGNHGMTWRARLTDRS